MRPAELSDTMWRFLRRSLDARGFERLVYANTDELQDALGTELHLVVLSVDYGSDRAVADLRAQLRDWMNECRPAACKCVQWPDRSVVPWGYDTATLVDDDFAMRAERNPWLTMEKCKVCRQDWYVAHDTVDDDLYFLRLTDGEGVAIVERGVWPRDFDQFDNVWREPDFPMSGSASRLDYGLWVRVDP